MHFQKAATATSVLLRLIVLLSLGSITLLAQPALNLPATPVQGMPTLGTATFLNVTFAGIPAGFDVADGSYRAWCIDAFGDIANGSYRLYSSYDPALPTLDLGPASAWPIINYLINHKQ